MKNTTIRRCLAAMTSLSMILTPVSALAQTQTPEVQAEQNTDKRLLQQAINEADRLIASGATENVNEIVLAKLNTALAKAKAVNADADATQAEINDAWLQLANIIQMLGFTSDKTALQEAIAKAEMIDLEDHYDDGKEELQLALANALEVNNSDTALTEQSIQAALDRLNAAIAALRQVEVLTLYRVYNPNSGEHFFTADVEERDHLIDVGWWNEGIGWYIPDVSSIPVYRVYNPNAGDHHYTTDAEERDHLVSVGWRDEGIGWHSDHKMTQNVYRVYNPNAKAGAHHFTIDKEEADHLVSVGWRDEGVGFHSR